MRSRIKKYAPRPIKRLVRRGIDREAQLELIVRASFHSRNLRLLVHELRRGCETSVEMYARLVHAWENEKFSAGPEYLVAIAQAVRKTSGPVLECGSGLSSLVIGIEAERRGVRAFSLEHKPFWAARTRRALERHELASVQVLHAPIRSYGGFCWYEVPTALPERFSLVVCDGPPADSCGRYGLLPVLGSRVEGEILLDDAGRPDEARVIARWIREFGVQVSLEGTLGPFARIRP